MLLSVANNEEKMIMANASIKNEKDGVLPEELKEMIDTLIKGMNVLQEKITPIKKPVSKIYSRAKKKGL